MEMIVSLEHQAAVFLLSVLMGAGLGLGYDCIRLFRRTVPHSRLWVQAEDALFWTAAVFFVFRVLLEAADGELRFFVFLGLFGGMGLYFLLASAFVLRAGIFVIELLLRAGMVFLEIVFTPFRLFLRLFRRPLGKAQTFCEKQRKKVLQLCKVCVTIRRRLYLTRKILFRGKNKHKGS